MTQKHEARISVILPAHNEADFIGASLASLIGSKLDGMPAELIVVPNGCSDDTAEIARSLASRAEAAGWSYRVVESAEGGKPRALDLGEEVATGRVLVYVDADVIASPGLIPALAEALDNEAPLYGSGRPSIPRSPSAATRAYARIWTRLPLFKAAAPGFGLFAINRAGRARWGKWPKVRGDDVYARLMFKPEERVEVPHGYEWPLTDGFMPLVKVRRRQDGGTREALAIDPDIVVNDGGEKLGRAGVLRLLASDPVGMIVYAAVKIASRTGTDTGGWARGR